MVWVKNDIEAFRWYSMAAAQGSGNMQFELGQIYQYGNVVEKNTTEDIRWYKEAANQGNKDAEEKLQNLNKKYF